MLFGKMRTMLCVHWAAGERGLVGGGAIEGSRYRKSGVLGLRMYGRLIVRSDLNRARGRFIRV